MTEFMPGPESVFCVPSLAVHALQALTGISVALQDASRDLGVTVRAGDPNPWNLGVADRVEDAGVQIAQAERLIPVWLRTLGAPVAFSYTAANQFPFNDGETYFESCSGPHSCVGAAVDWSVLTGGMVRSLHVVEVINYRGQSVRTLDWTSVPPTAAQFSIVEFERAMTAANGGFLIFELQTAAGAGR